MTAAIFRTALLCLGLVFPLAVKAETAAPTGHVLITLGGAVEHSNLPPRQPDDGGLFGYLEVTYDMAMGFDADMLDAFEQVEVTIPYGPEGNRRDIAFSGPRLADVIEAAGGTGKTARPMALDGYQAEIAWADVVSFAPILATRADGAPMGLGSYGPTMIVFPATDDAEVRERQAAQQVWALAYIGIE